MAVIDVGPGAIDRASAGSGLKTIIDLANPANDTGKIDTFEIWCAIDSTGVKMGTFYGSGTDYTSRDVETIGDVTGGSKQTFSGLDCDVSTGDYAGLYWVGTSSLELDSSGGSGFYYKAGDQFGTGQQTYTLAASYAVSIYGTGTTAVVLQPTGISSAEGFGTTQLNLKLEPSGIASIEAFGAAKLNLNIALSGIVSAEAFGTPIVIGGLTIFPPAIPSAEAFGNLVIAGPLIVPGIASAEAFGSLTVSPGGVIVAPSGISSEELFGLPELNLFVTPSGIVTSEAFGTAKLNLKLILSGIASAEAFGNPTLGMFLVIRPSGLASVQAVGSPILIVILAKGTDMKLPPGIPGEVSIPSKKVSLPWE